MKSNFSKLSLCTFLCILIAFGDIPKIIKAETETLELKSAGSTTYINGDGEYEKQLTMYAYDYENNSTINLYNYLYYPTNYNNANSYIKSINDTYKSVTFSLFGSLSNLLFTFEITNKMTKSLDITINIQLDEIYIPLNFGGAEDYFSSVPGNFLQTQYTLRYIVPQNSTITRNYNTSESFFNGYNTQYSLAENYQFPDIFNRDFFIRLPIKITVNTNANKNDFELKFTYTTDENNKAILKSLNNGKFILPTPPIDMPDWRMLSALRSIWSAINGQGTGNLASIIEQQTQQQTNTLTNGFDNTAGNNTVQGIQGEINKLQQAESGADQAKNALKDINFDNYMDFTEAGSGIVFLTTTANSIFTAVPQLKAIVIAGFLILLISIIIGLRRFF